MNYLRQKLYAPHFLISAEPTRFILTIIISYNSRLSEECTVKIENSPVGLQHC